MSISRFAALAVGLVAAGSLVGIAAPQASAMSGSCSGGQLTMNTNPIGMNEGPVTAQIDGQLTGCTGTPSQTAHFTGDFTGNGSCLDVNGMVNANLDWGNGQNTAANGPYHVAGGPTPPPSTNTVPTSDGGSMTVQQAGPDAGAVTGPCLSDSARTLSVPITNVTFA